nr:aromatic acid exporter family protein [Agromyces seonyuensis]
MTTAQRLPIIQTAKVAIATSVAWAVCGLVFSQGLPVFGAIAALLVVQPSVNQSLGKAIERSLGVILGVTLAFLLNIWFEANTWVVLSAIVLAIFLSWALRLTQGTTTQIVVSAMLVLSVGASDPIYAVDRVLETIVGAAIGVVVNTAIVPPVEIGPARAAILALGDELASALDRLAYSLRHPQTRPELDGMLAAARHCRDLAETARASLETADDSLMLNPRRGGKREDLADQHVVYDRVLPLVTQIVGMTRTVHDHWDVGLLAEPTVTAIAQDLERASHDLRLVLREHAGEPSPTETAAIPVLTAPIAVAEPHPKHWLLIGALLEDLRRVREQIMGAPE